MKRFKVTFKEAYLSYSVTQQQQGTTYGMQIRNYWI